MNRRLGGRRNRPLRPAWGYRAAGFTLLELLSVVIMVAILASIAAPSWFLFQINWTIKTARDQLHQGLQQAQQAAITHRQVWRFSLRQRGDRWEWAIHPNRQPVDEVPHWEPLHTLVDIDDPDTTLPTAQGVHYVRFGYHGEVIYRLGTLTVGGQQGVGTQQCVIVSTLIGNTRKGQEQLYPNGNGRYCY